MLFGQRLEDAVPIRRFARPALVEVCEPLPIRSEHRQLESSGQRVCRATFVRPYHPAIERLVERDASRINELEEPSAKRRPSSTCAEKVGPEPTNLSDPGLAHTR